MDLIYLVALGAFLALTWGMAAGCCRLGERK